MKASLKTFKCGIGDCIFLRLSNSENGATFHIMIDCGKLTSEIRHYIHDILHDRIDLLIVTHIDSDHIDGITEMLYDAELCNLTIRNIIYNCCQKPEEAHSTPLDETSKRNLLTAQNCLKQSSGSKISARSSLTLAAAILGKENLKQAWHKQAFTDQSVDLPLGEEWGEIIFLSPSSLTLERLYKKFRTKFAGVTGTSIPPQPFDEIESTYEMLLKLESKQRNRFIGRKISGTSTIDEASLKRGYLNDTSEAQLSDENKASIAFIWKCHDKKVLFLGDAACSQVLNRINNLFPNEKAYFEAIKVSHHGSKYSTSSDLYAKIDSKQYFITGGDGKDRPSLDAIAKVVMRPSDDNIDMRTISFNTTCKMVDLLKGDGCESLRDKYHFTIQDNSSESSYEFEY